MGAAASGTGRGASTDVSASDVLLGWSDSEDGHQFYIRQLADMK